MSALHIKVRAREGGLLSERGYGAHRAEVGCEACQLVSCSWGGGHRRHSGATRPAVVLGVAPERRKG